MTTTQSSLATGGSSASPDGPIGIAGAGRIAQALGRLLRERGEPVVAVAARDPGRAEAAAAFIGAGVRAVRYVDLPARASRVLVAVSDDAVTPVAEILAQAGMNQGAALHTCGRSGPEALAPLAGAGVSCGSIHPLQTVATPEQGVAALVGVTFAIDGQGRALAWAEQIAGVLQGHAIRVDAAHRALYHAAAVTASNHVVGLIDAAVMLMSSAGIDEDTALRAIGPLVRASVANAIELGPVTALTGPVDRGDAETVAAHCQALANVPESIAAFYRAAALHLVQLARRRNLPEEQARKIEEILRENEKRNG